MESHKRIQQYNNEGQRTPTFPSPVGTVAWSEMGGGEGGRVEKKKASQSLAAAA